MSDSQQTYLERDRHLASQGVPLCPRCGERDRIKRIVGNWWCERCVGFVAALEPRPTRYVPDF